MGSRGPVPKRSAEQAGHRTKEEQPDKTTGEVVKPPPASREWAPEARNWYKALKRSGQSHWFEPSDWEYARLLCRLLTEQLQRAKGPSSEMVKAILNGMDQLATTEAARRRLRIEVERPEPGSDDEGKVAVMQRYREAAGG